ncbi:AAA family ATPase [Oryzisolibacter sp. LB2S]|uniref:bifunctional aminoglycoside phosphotransferase/ATP-binding protein n=1 Tax=Alicycliphilus soli TaxID=3228789 RepID=UPI003459B565
MTDELSAGNDLATALAEALQQAEGGPVQHLQTHLSHLLLTPRHAYKLKKPLCLPFADFSTLAARRHFCAEELRLNQRLAPALYLDMLPVLGGAQGPRLGQAGDEGDEGEAIDWVLRMRRFPAGSELDTLVSAGRLAPEALDAFAERLARFHAEAPVAPADGPGGDWGSAAQVGQAIGAVFDQLDALLGAAERARLAALRQWFDARQPQLSAHWAARRAAGRVREGHGDLHLGNVVCVDGVVTAFDCLEFSPALRWIDVMADAGFFTMDLHAHGRGDLAWRFLDGYLATGGDYEGLAVLRPYEVYRALVRAMAGRLRAAQGGEMKGPDYLACAERLAAPAAPRLLITHGLSGSGKSTVAARLLEQGAVRLRSDVERKRLYGLAPLADSAAQGLDIYTPEASRRTFAHLAQQARAVLLAGWPVIVDAAFLRRAEREQFHALARGLGLPFAILHCHAAPDSLRARVQRRLAAGTDPSEADLAVLARQQQHAEPLAPEELPHVMDLATDQPWDAGALWQRWLAMTGQGT